MLKEHCGVMYGVITVRCPLWETTEGAVASVLLASRAGDAVSSRQGLDPSGEDRPLVDRLLALVQVTR